MNIDRNNPETWNRPGWESNSCYANSALWALLYNNVYVDLISGTELIPNVDLNVVESESEIKENLSNFHYAINSDERMNSIDVYNFTKNIRQEISNLKKAEEWKTEGMDPADFLMAISQIYTKINNCDINSNLLPLIRLGDLNINASGKTVTFKMFGEAKSCDFNSNDGLIVQYGDGRDPILEEKYYSIGKYKLYAFIHYINRNHYSCYFEFNNEWYNFDDLENGHQGRIIKVERVERKIIYNESFIFFYKFDETILTDINVTLTEYFSRDDRTLSIVDDHEPLANSKASSFRFTTPLPSKEVTTYNFQPQIETKNWIEIFNRCNDIKEELEPHYKTIEDVDKAIKNVEEEYQSEIIKLNKEYDEEILKYQGASGSNNEIEQKINEKRIDALKLIRGKARETIKDLEEIKRKLKTETPQETVKPEAIIQKSTRERGTPEEIIKKRKERNATEEDLSEKRERSEGGTKRNQINKCKLSRKNSNYNKGKKSRKCKKNRKGKKSRKNIN